jgi:hypothetical protein
MQESAARTEHDRVVRLHFRKRLKTRGEASAGIAGKAGVGIEIMAVRS